MRGKRKNFREQFLSELLKMKRSKSETLESGEKEIIWEQWCNICFFQIKEIDLDHPLVSLSGPILKI